MTEAEKKLHDEVSKIIKQPSNSHIIGLSSNVHRIIKLIRGATIMETLQNLYDSEINVRISWNWDGGIDVQLGGLPGYNENTEPDAKDNVRTLDEAEAWFIEKAKEFYPTSTFVKNLLDYTKGTIFDEEKMKDSLDSLNIRKSTTPQKESQDE